MISGSLHVPLDVQISKNATTSRHYNIIIRLVRHNDLVVSIHCTVMFILHIISPDQPLHNLCRSSGI